MKGDQEEIREYSADVSNYMMKAVELWGGGLSRPSLHEVL